MIVPRIYCPVCNSRDLVELFRRPFAQGEVRDFLIGYYDLAERGLADGWAERFAGLDYVLRGCNSCRAITQENAPDDEFAAELYGTWIDERQRPAIEGGLAPGQDQAFEEFTHEIQQALILTAFLLRRSGRRRPGRLKILDFGLGWGRFAMAMRACGCQVHAFDLSTARMRQAELAGLIATDQDTIPGQDFDFVNTEQVFEHLPEPRKTIELLHSGLGPRGVLKISVPFARWAEREEIAIDWKAGRYARNSWMPFHPLEHLTYFRRPSLHKLSGSLGMTEVRLGAAEQLYYSFEWGGLRSTARNLARVLPRRWFRNYFLFSKI